jgi:hypothetical protein
MGRLKKGYADRYRGENCLRKKCVDLTNESEYYEIRNKKRKKDRKTAAIAAATKKGKEEGIQMAEKKAERIDAKKLKKLRKTAARKTAKKLLAKKKVTTEVTSLSPLGGSGSFIEQLASSSSSSSSSSTNLTTPVKRNKLISEFLFSPTRTAKLSSTQVELTLPLSFPSALPKIINPSHFSKVSMGLTMCESVSSDHKSQGKYKKTLSQSFTKACNFMGELGFEGVAAETQVKATEDTLRLRGFTIVTFQ